MIFKTVALIPLYVIGKNSSVIFLVVFQYYGAP